MKVKELMAKLAAMPEDAEVRSIWDGAARSKVSAVYLARSGTVMLAEAGDVVYGTEARPLDAPSREQDPYWEIPETLD